MVKLRTLVGSFTNVPLLDCWWCDVTADDSSDLVIKQTHLSSGFLGYDKRIKHFVTEISKQKSEV